MNDNRIHTVFPTRGWAFARGGPLPLFGRVFFAVALAVLSCFFDPATAVAQDAKEEAKAGANEKFAFELRAERGDALVLDFPIDPDEWKRVGESWTHLSAYLQRELARRSRVRVVETRISRQSQPTDLRIHPSLLPPPPHFNHGEFHPTGGFGFIYYGRNEAEASGGGNAIVITGLHEREGIVPVVRAWAALGAIFRGMQVSESRIYVPDGKALLRSQKVPSDWNLAGNGSRDPSKPLRGHLCASHFNSISFDNWDAAHWKDYINSLAFDGNETVGFYPLHAEQWRGVSLTESGPAFDTAADRTKFTRFFEAQKAAAAYAHGIGMRVGAWIPPNDIFPANVTPDDHADPKRKPGKSANVCPQTVSGRKKILAVREFVFRELPHLDWLFIPSHDNGGCDGAECKNWAPVYAALAKETFDLCKKYHPKAQCWLSNQKLSMGENRHLEQIAGEGEAKTPWFSAVVWGPSSNNGTTLKTMRKRFPTAVGIPLYPDITHGVDCQYPLKGIDYSFKEVYRRDAPLFRPTTLKAIFDETNEPSMGSVPYSEGCYDDFNKFLWTQMIWDPKRPPDSIAREWCRWHFGPDAEETGARLVSLLESNWMRPIAGNPDIEKARELADRLAAAVPPRLAADNWRMRLLLYRAYGDALVRDRHLFDLETLEKVLLALGKEGAPPPGPAALRETVAWMKPRMNRPPPAERIAPLKQWAEELYEIVLLETPSFDRMGKNLCGLDDLLAGTEAALALADDAQYARAVEALRARFAGKRAHYRGGGS
ncbi:MAG: hypothetical protein HY719_13065 [Planctomycetes bacterium]|nr:hypothetical protein [Planctomycetota bacterium]